MWDRNQSMFLITRARFPTILVTFFAVSESAAKWKLSRRAKDEKGNVQFVPGVPKLSTMSAAFAL